MHFFKRLITYIGLYGAISFTIGFVLMAYELVASRILAPSIGTSMYVWTSVIGVMIAALAAGYAVGGWLADKRVAKTDIAWLLLASSLSLVWTCVGYEYVLHLTTSTLTDVRAQGVVAAVVLFMPTSFLLGVISPYLARLRVRSLASAGRSVAGLSALNSLGGISGTFCTGFIFFSFFGSRETLAAMTIVLLAASWFIEPRRHIRLRLAMSGAVVLCTLAFVFTPLPRGTTASIDTPSAHYEVRSLSIDGQRLTGLVTSPTGIQSGVLRDDPDQLVFAYTRTIADLVAAAPHKNRVLVLGGGAFTLPEYIARQFPGSTVDVVEIDPQLESIAQKYFDYQPLPNVRIFAEDARAFLNHTTNMYDIVIVDVYHGSSVPFALTTREYAAALSHVVNTNGVVMANIIGSTAPACKPFLASIDSSYKTAFQWSSLHPMESGRLQMLQNIIGTYAHQPQPWATGIQLAPTQAQPLTDDFAPVERLYQTCNAS